jgi:Cysteine-rich CWC
LNLDSAVDACPRCGAGFHCGAGDDAPCACTLLVLTAELQARLRERFSGCLCLACLTELAQEASPRTAPTGAG